MVPAEYVRTAADRLAVEQGCYFDAARADSVCQFAESLFKPQYVSGPFRLLPWQTAFLRSLYGWRLPDGSRRFRTANLHVSKKNGKTLISSVICLYELLASGNPSPFVASGSVSKENAGQIFAEIKNTVRNSPLGRYATITDYAKRVYFPGLNSTYRALASDGDTAQGYNLTACVVDEYHAHKNNSLYDSLRYSTIARQGLLVVISTAGDDPTHPYYSLYSKSKRVLSGEDLDTTHYAEVHESDPDADPADPAEWRKSNPSLGTSFSVDDFRRDLEAARGSVPEWMAFSRYRLNRWIRPSELAFIDLAQWDRNKAQPCPTEDELRRCPCFLGCDLSTSIDPSSVSACWLLPGGRFYVRSWAWVAQKGVALREKANLTRYQEFIQQGSMTMTPGDMIDHHKVMDFLRQTARRYSARSMLFDGNNALLMMETLQSEGFAVRSVPQYPRYWNPVMREWERSVADGRLTHDGGAWLRYCCGNVRLKTNDRGEISPSKAKSPDKIDGFVSACLAYSDALSASVKPKPGAIEVW